MRIRAVVLAAALILAPPGARAADLVVWWNKGFYAEEDAAVREIVAAFEQKTGKQVELTQPAEDELPGQVAAALEAGQPPDFAFGVLFQDYIAKWAFEDRLVDLSDAVGHFSDLFDPDALATETLLEREDRAEGPLRACRWPATNHVHVWKSLLEQAGFSARRHPTRVGGVLVVLVRPGPAGGAQGHWAATTSGASACPCRPAPPTPTSSSIISCRPTGRTT